MFTCSSLPSSCISWLISTLDMESCWQNLSVTFGIFSSFSASLIPYPQANFTQFIFTLPGLHVQCWFIGYVYSWTPIGITWFHSLWAPEFFISFLSYTFSWMAWLSVSIPSSRSEICFPQISNSVWIISFYHFLYRFIITEHGGFYTLNVLFITYVWTTNIFERIVSIQFTKHAVSPRKPTTLSLSPKKYSPGCLKAWSYWKLRTSVQCMKIWYKLVNNNVSTYFASMFRYKREWYDIQTRSYELLYLYLVCTSNARNALRHRIPELLCKYPTAVLEKAGTHSIMSFTSHVKFHLLESYCSDCLIPQCYTCTRLT